jgi:beta-glucosidase
VGNIGPVPRLGFDGLCLQDGPLAIREADYASVFPAGLTVAASWDRSLAHVRGQDMGDEFVGKGAHVALGPVAGPLGRSGYGGRNWEGFSPDPWLTGELFAETIIGMEEQGIQACAKREYNPWFSRNALANRACRLHWKRTGDAKKPQCERRRRNYRSGVE